MWAKILEIDTRFMSDNDIKENIKDFIENNEGIIMVTISDLHSIDGFDDYVFKVAGSNKMMIEYTQFESDEYPDLFMRIYTVSKKPKDEFLF